MTPIILGSGSAIRARILQNAGVAFTVVRPDVDEDAYKRSASATPAEVALGLAKAKALAVSARAPGALVVGADQTGEFEGRLIDKAASLEEARARLAAFRGKTHALHAATALARDGEIVWSEVRTSRLTVRMFSDAFLDTYMAAAGGLTASVGAYEYEGWGAQLFDEVDGDYFAVLGLPLLQLLAALRAYGGLAA